MNDAQSSWPGAVTAANRQFQQQHPGVDVNVIYQTWGEHTTKFDASLAAGNAPDVKELGNTETVKYMAAGALADITAQKVRNADYESQLKAIIKSQAVIEFDLQGNIVNANDNFLMTLGYSLDEIRGRHHRMFCEPSFVASAEYAQFWANLNNGTFQSGEYKRIGKGGKVVWIQASYNPILGLDGRPCKVVKYAMDVTPMRELIAAYEAAKAARDARAEQATERQLG